MLYEHGGQEKQQKIIKQATNIQTGTSQIHSEISSNFNVKICFSSLGVCVCVGGGGGGGSIHVGGKRKGKKPNTAVFVWHLMKLKAVKWNNININLFISTKK